MLGDVSWTFILSAQDDGPEPDCWGSVSVSGFIGLIDCLSFIFIYLHLGEGSVKELWAVAENSIWFGPK